MLKDLLFVLDVLVQTEENLNVLDIAKKKFYEQLLIFFAKYQIETQKFNTDCTQCVRSFIVGLYP